GARLLEQQVVEDVLVPLLHLLLLLGGGVAGTGAARLVPGPEGEVYTFMDTTTFEQYHLSRADLGDTVGYLTPNLQLKVEFFEGKPIGIELPATVDLKVVETEPGIKGASATNVMKPARVETGITVLVPPFISEGEVVRVDPSDGTYLERAK
ncbi:MAG: hypothetical protein L0212_04205, partial [Acidobacteria bacterium]|nr:hypothetical protein [Acidobacteriota bacterium]